MIMWVFVDLEITMQHKNREVIFSLLYNIKVSVYYKKLGYIEIEKSSYKEPQWLILTFLLKEHYVFRETEAMTTFLGR